MKMNLYNYLLLYNYFKNMTEQNISQEFSLKKL